MDRQIVDSIVPNHDAGGQMPLHRIEEALLPVGFISYDLPDDPGDTLVLMQHIGDLSAIQGLKGELIAAAASDSRAALNGRKIVFQNMPVHVQGLIAKLGQKGIPFRHFFRCIGDVETEILQILPAEDGLGVE